MFVGIARSTLLLVISLFVHASSYAQLNLNLPENTQSDYIYHEQSAQRNQHKPQYINNHVTLNLLRQLRARRPMLEDAELSTWLYQLGNRLARHAQNYNGPLYFLLEDNPAINAYALPGGIVTVTSGLVLNAESGDELASVIAHEIAHTTQRHIERTIAARKDKPFLTGLGILAGAAAATQSSEAARAIISSSLAFQAHQQITFSHRIEAEADREGLRILANAGMNPHAMPYFLEKLDRKNSSLYQDIGKYLSTHPLTIDRLSDIRNRAARYPKRAHRPDPNFFYAREKLRAVSRQTASIDAAKNLTPNLRNYHRAVSLEQTGNYQGVLQQFQGQPHTLFEALLMARSLNALKRQNEALKLLAPWQQRHPQYAPLLLIMARAQLQNQQSAQALALLRRIPLTEGMPLQSLEEAQSIAHLSGKPAIALRYAAERHIRLGQYQHARVNIERALRTPGINPAEKSQLQQRLQAIRTFSQKRR